VNLQDHHLILALLACAAVLGVAVGYCIEVLRSSSREAQMNGAWEKERDQLRAALDKQQESARTVMTAERKSAADARLVSERALSRHDAMQLHTETQSKKISNLEAQLRAAEEQNVKVQSDFATYKANKDREFDVLRVPQRSDSQFDSAVLTSPKPGADQLPVLSKRVGAEHKSDSPISERLVSNLRTSTEPSRVSRKRAVAAVGSFPTLIPDSEIPRLAESEIQSSADELDFASLLGSDDEVTTSG